MAQAKDQDKLKPELIEEIRKNYGNVSMTCDLLDISRTTYYDWLKKDPEFKRRISEVLDFRTDRVESKLMELIDGVESENSPINGQKVYVKPPDVSAIIFYLKTKGKHRGYTEKQEVQLTDINVNVKVVE